MMTSSQTEIVEERRRMRRDTFSLFYDRSKCFVTVTFQSVGFVFDCVAAVLQLGDAQPLHRGHHGRKEESSKKFLGEKKKDAAIKIWKKKNTSRFLFCVKFYPPFFSKNTFLL